MRHLLCLAESLNQRETKKKKAHLTRTDVDQGSLNNHAKNCPAHVLFSTGSTRVKWVGRGKIGSVDCWKTEGPELINQHILC